MATAPDEPHTVYTDTTRIACDGATATSPALGHPRVYLQINDSGQAQCGYCDKRFILAGGPADARGGIEDVDVTGR